MPRTTEQQVALIIDLDDAIDLTPFIDTATTLLDAAIEKAEADYTTAHEELIERWLTAHFYTMIDPRTTMEGVKGITEKYEGRTDLGLNHSRYGQQAMLLDYAGGLADINREITSGKLAIKPQITWLGTEEVET